METTTIQIDTAVKLELADFKEHARESYNHVLHKMINLFKQIKKQPELTKQALLDIAESRKQFEKGEFYSLEDVEKRLGLA